MHAVNQKDVPVEGGRLGKAGAQLTDRRLSSLGNGDLAKKPRFVVPVPTDVEARPTSHLEPEPVLRFNKHGRRRAPNPAQRKLPETPPPTGIISHPRTS
jgi:hypothetical protein